MAQEDNRTINPNATTIYVGIKQLRPITIYPLSINDQMHLTDKFSEVIQEFGQVSKEEMTNERAINFMKDFLQRNLPEFMEFVVDPDENDVPTLDEVTNNQLYTITNTVFQVNYEELIKNFKDLFGRVQKMVNSGMNQDQ